MKYCIGLTGGIGSGKSTVADLFREQGIAVIDTDEISRLLTRAGGIAIDPICAAFGKGYITADGALDRSKMRQLVFSDPIAKKQLEGILHPLIRARMLAQAEDAVSPYVLLVIPLLFEAENYRDLLQRVLVVDCLEETQVLRAMRRSALSESEVRAIMSQQLPRAARLQLADDVIHNDGPLNELPPQILELHRIYLNRSSESLPTRH